MELFQIRTFIQIAQSGTMTKASAELHRTQPALSAQLAKLEEELGEDLFDRTPKGMELTHAGELFLSYAEQAMTRLDDGLTALARFRGLEHGSLSIGGGVTATTYLLPPIFGRFRRDYPSIRLQVREKASAEIQLDLLNGLLDLGVVTLPLTESDPRNMIAVIPWIDDELVLIAPPYHPLSQLEYFQWKNLRNVPLVLFEKGSVIRSQIELQMSAAGIAPEIAMELRSVEAIKHVVMEGIGAAFVSKSCLLTPNSPKGIPCAEGRLSRQLALIYRRDLTVNPATEAFLDLIGIDKKYRKQTLTLSKNPRN